jgi:hypothetical protein
MLMIRIARLLIAFTFAVSFVAGGVFAQSNTASPKKPEPTITLTTKPAPPAAGQTTVTVTAKDATGRPIIGADVTIELVMPPMGAMAEMKNTITLKAASDPKLAAGGMYVGAGQIMMAGKWTATVDVRVSGKSVARRQLPLAAR